MRTNIKQEKLDFEYSKAKGLLLAKLKFALEDMDDMIIDSLNRTTNWIEEYYKKGMINQIIRISKERGSALLEYNPKYPSSYNLPQQQKVMEEYFVITGRKFKDDFESSDDIIKRILKRKFIIDEEEGREVINFISDNHEEAKSYLPKLNKLLLELEDRLKN
ncbi:MAG: hypothetical protein U5N85_21590 [Arcicella sp.]|nr:hypothetical protein [Arcicella sp.]